MKDMDKRNKGPRRVATGVGSMGASLIVLALAAVLMASCGKNYTVPADAVANGKDVVLYPDYSDVTVPSNIAPLNFIVKAEADEFVVQVKADGKDVMVSGGSRRSTFSPEQPVKTCWS